MALTIPDLQSSPTYPAQAVMDSTDIAAIVASLNTSWELAYGGTNAVFGNMNILPAQGSCMVNGQVYTWTASVLTVATASATDRKDILVYTAGTGLQLVAGTPCSVAGWTTTNGDAGVDPPVKPAIPANSILLAEIYVPGSATSVSASNIVDKAATRPGVTGTGPYGDGSDGAAVFDGTTTNAGTTLAGSTYTATRDLQYATFKIDDGITLKMAGFRLMCQTPLVGGTSAQTAYISNDGSPGGANTGGTGGTAGAGAPTGSLAGGAAGAAGPASSALGTGGTAGSPSTNSYGGSGVAGAASTLGDAGGAGGSATAPAASAGAMRSLPFAAMGAVVGNGTVTAVKGGAGGGSGGSDGSNGGAGGGGGGGGLYIAAPGLTGYANITARGGAGGTSTQGSGHGNGGGGGGGWIVLVTTSTVDAVLTAGHQWSLFGLWFAWAWDGSGGYSSPTVGTVIIIPN